ncbi:uncharacterized protein LOC129039014 isoform X2 [Pongo pygmaeus]|uniref:uncharacterized protein LOC129039014 isoform X2 n=1 Tax=Pongo pygmaeus TaxID=9600 RepID=UPI00300CF346
MEAFSWPLSCGFSSGRRSQFPSEQPRGGRCLPGVTQQQEEFSDPGIRGRPVGGAEAHFPSHLAPNPPRCFKRVRLQIAPQAGLGIPAPRVCIFTAAGVSFPLLETRSLKAAPPTLAHSAVSIYSVSIFYIFRFYISKHLSFSVDQGGVTGDPSPLSELWGAEFKTLAGAERSPALGYVSDSAGPFLFLFRTPQWRLKSARRKSPLCWLVVPDKEDPEGNHTLPCRAPGFSSANLTLTRLQEGKEPTLDSRLKGTRTREMRHTRAGQLWESFQREAEIRLPGEAPGPGGAPQCDWVKCFQRTRVEVGGISSRPCRHLPRTQGPLLPPSSMEMLGMSSVTL